jgi:Bacterial Ig domain
VVGAAAVDRIPAAADDTYATATDTPVSGNVLGNDDPGDAPAVVSLQSGPASGALELAGDGNFTYTPGPGFEGADQFSYRLTDADGDLSNTAVATLTVSAATSPGAPGLTATPFKDKGIQQVLLEWQNFAGPQVDIYRDGDLLAAVAASDGNYLDNLQTKGSGQVYRYRVCEAGSGTCAEASAAF